MQSAVVRPKRASSLPLGRISSRENKESISQGLDIFVASEASYDENYETAHNFRLQEFKDFEPMDDAISLSGSIPRFQNAPVSPSSTGVMSPSKIKPKATRASSEEKKYTSGAFSYGAYEEIS